MKLIYRDEIVYAQVKWLYYALYQRKKVLYYVDVLYASTCVGSMA